MAAHKSRSERLNLRLTPDAMRVLRMAAIASRRSLRAFVLESALARAEETLPDCLRFGLNADQWVAFQAALDAPTRDPGLRRETGVEYEPQG